MKKKYLAGILTATLLTGTLFGCGSQSTQVKSKFVCK